MDVSPEHTPATRLRVREAGKARLGAGCLVSEGQRCNRGRDGVGNTLDILAGLPLDLGERRPVRLRLENPYELTINIERVVAASMALPMDELAKGYPLTSPQIGLCSVLDLPPGLYQLSSIFFRALASAAR